MRATFAFVFCLPLVLTGCALTSSDAPTADPGLAIQGRVYGGQQPVVGARVYLLAAGTGGTGGSSSSLLLPTGSNTVLDTDNDATKNDYYVTTGAGGIFSISADYSCTPNTQVYLYIQGGDPGINQGPNAAIGLMAALGNCPSTGSFLPSVPFITVNEVSTVAAAYSFAGFATDATHVSSSNTSLGLAGIKNAFANAANLADISGGTALATTSGGGIAPQSTVYTLANILASCVNSNGQVTGGATPSACYTLFNNAKSNGTTGTAPIETATAAINIAHNPGISSTDPTALTALYGLSGGTPAFPSGLTAQPNDFTLAIQLTSSDMSGPRSVAIDGSGNAWVANSGHSSVTEFSSSGSVISGTTGWTGGGLLNPQSIAIDLQGNAWATNFTNSSVTKLAVSGPTVTATQFSPASLSEPYGVAVDGSGNVWVTNFLGNSVTELTSGGASSTVYNHGNTTPALNLSNPRGIAIDSAGSVWVASTANSAVVELSNSGSVLSAGYMGDGVNEPYGIAIDGEGNAWIPNYNGILNSTISELSTSRSPVLGSPYNEGGAYGPQAVAIDGSGNAWIADFDNNSISEFSSSGSSMAPSTGYAINDVDSPGAIAIDGSGNVWVANSGAKNVTELIGAAVPVVTPLAAGVKNGALGTRP